MQNDRNYYRMMEDDELIDLARKTDNELALVLAERLRKERLRRGDNIDT